MRNPHKILAKSVGALDHHGLAVERHDRGSRRVTRATPHGNGHNIHAFPTVTRKGLAQSTDPGPLVYNGGPVMQAGVTPYVIFWVPPKLQNGGTTAMSTHYRSVQTLRLADYMAHGIDNNNTQYTQQINFTGPKTYITK